NWNGDVGIDDICSCCKRPGNLRPDIVWFGEILMFMERIQAALESCDLFICIGTSGVVYPAAGFVQMAKASGAYAIECNTEQTAISEFYGSAVFGSAALCSRFSLYDIFFDSHIFIQ